jgi:hypothetical protein
MFKSIKKVTYVNPGDNMTDAVVRGVITGLAFVGIFNMTIQVNDLINDYKRLKDGE